MGLTREQRIEAIMAFRFSERQARFLDLVMRVGGVCVPRQYARFAGVANGGDKCNEFFQKLVFRGRAVRVDCVPTRAALYHIHPRRLYEAIGEGKSRYRRPVPARQAIERLMLLDAVLTAPDVDWLATEAEKLAHLAESICDGPVAVAPNAAIEPVAPVPPTIVGVSRGFPIGVDGEARTVLLYLVLQPWTDGFRAWLQAHVAWLQRLRTWTIRLVFPRPLGRTYDAHQRVIREEFETPLQSATAHELKWYFEHRPKRADPPVDSLTRRFLAKGAEVFRAPRFESLYRRWLKHGDVVLDGLTSSVLADALTTGAGRVESLALPHSYRHLAPVAPPPPTAVEAVEKAEERGEETATRPQPPRSTPPEEELTIEQRCARDYRRLVEDDIKRRRLTELWSSR
jgi:hypothetical protein